MANTLYYGDNLAVLRESIPPASVDLIYLDPPFNSQASYNVLFQNPAGQQSEAQLHAFVDTWHWDDAAEFAFDQVMRGSNTDVAEILRAMRSFLHENDMMAYLSMMSARLIELYRVLKPSGTLYLHCDHTASHYLKILLDQIFGIERFQAEILWQRTATHNDAKRWPWLSDSILCYTKTSKFTWNPVYRPQAVADVEKRYRFKEKDGRRYRLGPMDAPAGGGMSAINKATGKPNGWYEWRGYQPPRQGWRYSPETMQKLHDQGLIHYPEDRTKRLAKKLYLDESKGAMIGNIWTDIAPLQASSAERIGYSTQKPLSLLERILSASTREGDIVLDPFCGCGTAIHAAQKLGREWIGIDITHLAISLIERRLADSFAGIKFEVHGTPTDLDGAAALFNQDAYQFQWWAVSLVNAVPFGGKKRGADSGIDGHVYFKPDGRQTEKAIVSVKGGRNVNVAMIRDLGHVVDRESAKVGIFITLTEPTNPMRVEAVKAGYYVTPYGQFPKLQIFTIEDLFAGKRPQLPWRDQGAFKRAPRERLEDRQAVMSFG